jgi:hypothetical protein
MRSDPLVEAASYVLSQCPRRPQQQLNNTDSLPPREAGCCKSHRRSNARSQRSSKIGARCRDGDVEDDPRADFMNNVKKYVVSRTLTKVESNNSTLLEGELAHSVRELKETGAISR